DSILQISLQGNIRGLLNDRTTAPPKDFPMNLTITTEAGTEITLPVNMKTRGHFRKLKENCIYPPLLVQFIDTASMTNTWFGHQNELKLVMPCQGEEYVLREWMVYKLYNLITPMSFKARLVRLTLADEKAPKKDASFYAFLLEDEDHMAQRNQSIILEKKMIPQQAQLKSYLTTAVFEYMIGNTDWGVQFLQNIKLIANDTNSRPIIVPYDFDHAGIVNAPYAKPAPELQLSSVRERRYRGYCIQSLNQYDEIISLFNGLKPQFYNLFTSSTLLKPKYINSTLQFLDGFYNTIHNTKAWQKEFTYPCDKRGTGNVVIKGLKKD
nr:hypothetical protein [Saprospiraceae bacterium]